MCIFAAAAWCHSLSLQRNGARSALGTWEIRSVKTGLWTFNLMFMRRMLYVVGCLLFLVPQSPRAENVVEVSTKNGRTVYFRLSERPYAVIRGSEVLIESRTELERSVSFLIPKGVKMRVCDVDLTGIRTADRDAASVFRLLPDRLEVSGLGAFASVAATYRTRLSGAWRRGGFTLCTSCGGLPCKPFGNCRRGETLGLVETAAPRRYHFEGRRTEPDRGVPKISFGTCGRELQ